ncbi:MAG: hypothetical protein A2Z34_02795, partial [Planctomycetes bacterium RBG_16_59_8]
MEGIVGKSGLLVAMLIGILFFVSSAVGINPLYGQAAGNPPPLWSIGEKKVLFYRVDFSDYPGEPVTVASLQTLMATVNDFYLDASYGKMSLTMTYPPVLRLPQTAASYAALGNEQDVILADVRVVARNAGYDYRLFDREIVVYSAPGLLGSLAQPGGRGLWLHTPLNLRTTSHEIGHTNGALHGNLWKSTNDSINGAGSSIEYEDELDVMGGGGTYHFTAWYKSVFDWIVSSEVQTVISSGTYRLYALEDAIPVGTHALKIRRDTKRDYWVEFRNRTVDTAAMKNGVLLHWGYDVVGRGKQSELIDATPLTTGIADPTVVIGRTLSDPEVGIHITPVGKAGTTPESIDVVVNLGTFPGNGTPTVNLAADATDVGINTAVTLTATASDPDGDTLAYYWELGSGIVGSNSPTTIMIWSAAGEYVVRCTVSDMKGKTASDSVIVRVGSPTADRIGGRVTDSAGQPAWNVKVAGSFTTYDPPLFFPVTVTKIAFTDSDGVYNLVGLSSNNYTVTAQRWGYLFDPSGFANPVASGGNPTAIDFVGRVNSAPSTPGLTGPTTVMAAQIDVQTYTATSTDLETQNVSYTVDWGNSTTTQSEYRFAGEGVQVNNRWTVPGTYEIRAKATDSFGASSLWSSPMTVTVLPAIPAPTGLTTTLTSPFVVQLVWTDNSSNEDGFYIERSTSGGDAYMKWTFAGANVTGTNIGLSPATTYRFRIRAFNTQGESDPSNEVVVTTPANTPPTTPAVPSGATVPQVGTTQTYTASAMDSNGHYLYYTFEWGDGTALMTQSPTSSGQTASLAKTWSTPGTYIVRVKATDTEGASSDWSAGLAVTVVNAAPGLPSQPTGSGSLTVNQTGTFTTAATDPEGHQVQYIFDWGNGTTSTTGLYASGVSVSATNAWPAAGTYSVRVKATDQYGAASEWSASLSVQVTEQPPAAPSTLKAVAIMMTRIDLQWTDNASNESGFKVEQSNDNVNFAEVATVGANTTAYTLEGLTAATTYYYRVRAYNSTYQSAYSNTASSRTMSSSSLLTGISTRGYVGTGSNAMIGGFIITGTAPKTVLIRAKGPSFSSWMTGYLVDPYLQLYSGSTVVAQNYDWQTNDSLCLSPVVWKGTAADIQAVGVAPTNSKEAALLVTLPPGAYTAFVRGMNNGVGTGMVEVYELGSAYPSTSRLTGISTRGYVGTGSNAMIGGFIITGTMPKKVLIRAKGPSFSSWMTGYLADPYLQLYSGSTVVA